MVSRISLVVVWTAFAIWVGWMWWLSHSHGRFPVVSRAQLLAADVAVIAEVTARGDGTPVPKVKVAEVVWPADAPKTLVGRELELANLPGSDGFKSPGRYVLILTGKGDGPYRMTELPRSPLVDPRARQRVYPEVPEVIGQLREVPGPSLRNAS